MLKNALCTALAASFALAAAAQQVDKQQCLTCHGSFDSIIAKNVQVEADPKPVNPHTYIPHGQKKDDHVWQCTMCHTPHELPPKPGVKAESTIEPCFECHHNYSFEPCGACHDNK